MAYAIETLRRVASSNCTVLVTGESGTGKEVAVRLLHEMSSRKNGPLVAVNCGAISTPHRAIMV
jgi:sigma-54 specific flagellar transcriptional regulator A